METDFPVIEVKKLDEEPVRRGHYDHQMEAEHEAAVAAAATSSVYQATAVRVEEDFDDEEEDDIPEDWKQTSVDTPTPPPSASMHAAAVAAAASMRCDSAEDNAMMSIIEELPEDESLGSEVTAAGRSAAASGIVIGSQQEPQRRASDASSSSGTTVDSSNTGSDTVSSIKEERISPVTSNDSGVVDTGKGRLTANADLLDDEDPLDDDEEEEDSDRSPSPPLKKVTKSSLMDNPNNISVRNIARFWEDVSRGYAGGGGNERAKPSKGDFASMSKKWFSMPDLDEKKKREKEREEEMARLREEETRRRRAEEEEEEERRLREEEEERDVIKCDETEDDRDVCGIVPVKERMRLFKKIEAKSEKIKMKENKSKWFSMPSLDEPFNKDAYKGKRYDYSRSRSQLGGVSAAAAAPTSTQHVAVAAASPSSASRTYSQAPASLTLTTSEAAPIPLVSSSSKESEDFDLTPLRDRLKAFERSPSAQPVSKPVVSAPKVVAVRSKSSRSVYETYGAGHPFQNESAETSLTDSVASSHTSGSTVISASKVNGARHSTPPLATAAGAVYSWQDESNGEIYNDREPSVGKDEDEPLYVVENGKEFPLTPVSKRRSLFQSQEALDEAPPLPQQQQQPKMPKDIMRSEPIIKQEKAKRTSNAAPETTVLARAASAASSSDGGRNGTRSPASCSEDDDDCLECTDSNGAAAVKSSKSKYIEEEQEVLANINLVKAMKQKFLS